MTFLSIPDINVAWARIASEQLLLDKERASLTHRARYLEEVKKELYGEKEVEELKKEEKEEEDEGEDPWRNHPEPVKTHAGQDESPIWTPRRGWRNHPELVETQAGQEEDLTPRRQQGEKIAYHYKMPGWTYHHPSPAWYSHHYPQTGWTYYDPMPSWSYYDLHADKISFYYPSPHLSVHNPSQTWYYYDTTMGWTYCDHAQAWEFLHPAPYAPHVCPENSPDWTLYRVFQCLTFVV
ncbi:hypothetical protein B0H65DRAFT_425361 [Neurospora tetraspora]|uniref:Uncharacterized protein n=1 Tax=Neurospora tetraspora TaxID=94610 RepID=A0AAE0JEI3_9PEZI|nr:hypothetical protein B0H65DRAFT_425361 [Neurospora tetraspora]